MVTHDIELTDAQSELIERLVASGRYRDASEVMLAGLLLLERDEADCRDLSDRLTAGLDEAR